MEVRDSLTGALLARVVDRRETMKSATPQLATRVSNTSDFRLLFKDWAGITVKGIAHLKELSPVPADLQPKQKL